MKKGSRKWNRGQGTVEYLLMLAFGAVFAIQVARFFIGVFNDGMIRLEGNVESEVATGLGFR